MNVVSLVRNPSIGIKTKVLKTLKAIPQAIPQITSKIPKTNLPAPGGILSGFLGGIIGVIIGELLNPRPFAKTDLESVEKFLGYKAEPAKTAQPAIPADWFGGQNTGTLYQISYSRASTYRGTFYGWQDGFSARYGNGSPGPISNPELWIATVKLGTLKHWTSFNQGIPPLSNNETRPYLVKYIDGSGVSRSTSLSNQNGVWLRGFTPVGTVVPDGTNPPPKQEAIIENNSAVLAIPPQSVSANNPTLPAIPKTSQPTSTKEKKVGYPVLNPVNPPGSLPEALNRPQQDPGIFDPTSKPSIPVSPASGTIPGRSSLPVSKPASVSKPISLTSNPTTTIRRNVPTLPNSAIIEATNPAVPTLQNPATLTTPSLPIPLPLPGVNITESSTFDWSAVFAPIVLSSYKSSQFRDEVKAQAGDAICQSTKPGGCMQADVFNPLKNKLGDLSQGLGLIGEGANLSLNNSILNRVSDIQNKVNNSTFGLQAISNFMQKAWENTKLDKVLNVLNTVLALHNALMLSRNLAQTLGDVTSQALQFFKIKDAEDNFIDVNSVIGSTVNTWITNLVGAENYANIQQTWTSLNRIMVAGQGILYSVQGVKNAVLEGVETVGSWTAKIGNNMMIQGLLEERSFPWMDENINFRNPFSGFIRKLDTTEEVLSQGASLISSGVEAQESFNQLFEGIGEVKTGSEKLQQNLTNFDANKEATETQEKSLSTSPDIDRVDLIQLEPDEI